MLSVSPTSFILGLAGIQTMPSHQAVVPPTNAVFSITSTRKPSAAATAAAVMPLGASADDNDIVGLMRRHHAARVPGNEA